jgi:hypothetical protein
MISRLEQPQKQRLLRTMLTLIVEHVDELPHRERADVYEGVAIAAESVEPELSLEAARIASQIRDAEHAQLSFATLLRPQRQPVAA